LIKGQTRLSTTSKCAMSIGGAKEPAGGKKTVFGTKCYTTAAGMHGANCLYQTGLCRYKYWFGGQSKQHASHPAPGSRPRQLDAFEPRLWAMASGANNIGHNLNQWRSWPLGCVEQCGCGRPQGRWCYYSCRLARAMPSTGTTGNQTNLHC
jgi:hypothetical protein